LVLAVVALCNMWIMMNAVLKTNNQNFKIFS
jgi:hypothetical protein